MSNFRITLIHIFPSFTHILVSDGQEVHREGSEQHEEFRIQSESFISKKYGEYLHIQNSSLDFQSTGSACITIIPKTPEILEMISEEYGVPIKKVNLS